MTDSIILHHYDSSPYAEKVRLMFGLTNMHWKSLLSPMKPPRPNVDPLTGGYRRIPVAQMGADIFCDTSVIAAEIAGITDHPELDPANISDEATILMKRAEQEAFFAAVAAVPPLRLIGTMFRTMGLFEIIPFIKDRTSMLKGGTQKATSPAKAKQIIVSLLEALEARLEKNHWLDGDSPSIADFTVYHPLWLYVSSNRKPLQASANVQRWYYAVADIGHGQREDISQAYAFQLAKASAPRELPESSEDTPLPTGTQVNVAPLDYGLTPVAGVLAAITDNRIIVARETEQFGMLHVHFPRQGYSMTEL